MCFNTRVLMLIILPGSVNFDKHFEGKMEGYLEIFGRKLCGKKGNFGLWRTAGKFVAHAPDFH